MIYALVIRDVRPTKSSGWRKWSFHLTSQHWGEKLTFWFKVYPKCWSLPEGVRISQCVTSVSSTSETTLNTTDFTCRLMAFTKKTRTAVVAHQNIYHTQYCSISVSRWEPVLCIATDCWLIYCLHYRNFEILHIHFTFTFCQSFALEFKATSEYNKYQHVCII